MRNLRLALIAAAIMLAGCVKVEAWQKGNFAKRHMAFDPDSSESKFRQHVYQSKEGSSGGYGVAGGGCGCN